MAIFSLRFSFLANFDEIDFLVNFDENGLPVQNGSKMAIFSLKMTGFCGNFWFWIMFGHFWPLRTLNP